jgi:glycosyltransferase involved in cell wall biosynthesis
VISVVVSSYDHPRALAAVLRALAEQTDHDFEVIVSEDGRDPATAEAFSAWRPSFDGRVAHVTQDDRGFRVARARNRGALAARGEQLAFLDGDCVPRRRFVRALRRTARPGWFAASYRFELSSELTTRVLEQRLPVHRFGLAAYARHRRDLTGYPQWLGPGDRRRIGARRGTDFVPPYENYGFVSLARADFEAVNGYDMRYEGWGGEDVDLASRLRHLGLRCGWPGPQATLFHLWHPTRKDHERRYLALLRRCRAERRVDAVSGLRELEAERRSTVTR